MMKKAILILFIIFFISVNIYSQQVNRSLTRQTVEKIIEHNIEIFKLLHDNHIYDYTFQFLRHYIIYSEPSTEWPNKKVIANYYSKIICADISEEISYFFVQNGFEEDAFIQFVTCYFIIEIIRAEKFFFDKVKKRVNTIDDANKINKIFGLSEIFNVEDLLLVYKYYDQFLLFSLGDSIKSSKN
jgi:hypothetical protein